MPSVGSCTIWGLEALYLDFGVVCTKPGIVPVKSQKLNWAKSLPFALPLRQEMTSEVLFGATLFLVLNLRMYACRTAIIKVKQLYYEMIGDFTKSLIQRVFLLEIALQAI